MPIVALPNVVGLTRAAAITALAASNFAAQFQFAASSTVAAGLVISQTPSSGTNEQAKYSVLCVLSTGPAPTAGAGGDQWGASGGSATPVNADPQIGPSISTGNAPANAVYAGNASVIGAEATGVINQGTPKFNVPTTPKVG